VPKNPPVQIVCDRLIVCEGPDDAALLKCLGRHLGMNPFVWGMDQTQTIEVQIMPMDGKSDWSSKIEAVTMTPGFGAVGMLLTIRDSDQNPEAQLDSMRTALQRVSLTIAHAHDTWSNGSPRTAYSTFPSSTQPGELEDLCLAALATTDRHPAVDAFALAVEMLGDPPAKMNKVRIQAHLAAHRATFRMIGNGADAGMFDLDNAVFETLRALLTEMKSN
jgi:hypothetical protein